MDWVIRASSEGLAGEVRTMTGSDIRTCYQCGKCTAGCPIAAYADMGPRQLMHMVQLGEREQVLRSAGIWLCVGCDACTTRCPRDVKPSHVIDALRQLARRDGLVEEAPPSVEAVPMFHDALLTSLRFGGRLWEVFMVGLYKMKSLDLFSDIGLAGKMFVNGKLSLLPPHRSRDAVRVLGKIAKLRAAEVEARAEAEAEAPGAHHEPEVHP